MCAKDGNVFIDLLQTGESIEQSQGDQKRWLATRSQQNKLLFTLAAFFTLCLAVFHYVNDVCMFSNELEQHFETEVYTAFENVRDAETIEEARLRLEELHEALRPARFSLVSYRNERDFRELIIEPRRYFNAEFFESDLKDVKRKTGAYLKRFKSPKRFAQELTRAALPFLVVYVVIFALTLAIKSREFLFLSSGRLSAKTMIGAITMMFLHNALWAFVGIS